MLTIYKIYSDCQSYGGWNLEISTTDKELAKKVLRLLARKGYRETKAYQLASNEEMPEFAEEPPSFRDYVNSEFRILENHVAENDEDVQALYQYAISVDLATGETVSFNKSFYDLNKSTRKDAQVRFYSFESGIDYDPNCTLNRITTCAAGSIENARKRIKNWLKTQMDNYPENAVKPHPSLLKD